jgi:16S rRNA (cytosine967-C5)-methyltransferase
MSYSRDENSRATDSGDKRRPPARDSSGRRDSTGGRDRGAVVRPAGAARQGRSKTDPLTPRRVALEAITRVDMGSYANLVLPDLLAESGLDTRDKAFATELTYGTIRRRRSLDWVVSAHITREPDEHVLRLLHLGAYQLVFAGVPAHAAVDETVALAPSWGRGFVNAVMRRVAEDVRKGLKWPDAATELSYPDWILDRLRADLGDADAFAALKHMNEAPTVTTRSDGYVQDTASQWVAELVGVTPGMLVLDVCAAPGGKATAMAQAGACVIAADIRPHRVGLIQQNVTGLELGERVVPLIGSGLCAPFADETFGAVLLDVPCSGLGVLHRRPDARWRMESDEVAELVKLQRSLIDSSVRLVATGGVLVISACTLTAAESVDHDTYMAETYPTFVADLDGADIGDRWEPLGRGVRVLPQTHRTDGMVAFRYRKT